jgi:hypothetical protein
MLSRNLGNEEALAHLGLLRQNKKMGAGSPLSNQELFHFIFDHRSCIAVFIKKHPVMLDMLVAILTRASKSSK